MAITINTPSGQKIEREQMIAYLNTGTKESPVWSAIGRGTPDSSMELDWSRESEQDILGNTVNTMKKPVKTQSFDPLPPYADDAAAVRILDLSIFEEDAQALANQDVMVAHFYTEGNKAIRSESSSIEVTSYGGEGGGNLSMAVTITYGGNRTVGTVSKEDGTVTFSAGA